MAPTLDVTAEQLDLKWTAFDPVALVFYVTETDWSGDYKAEVRAQPHRHAPLLDELTVVATYEAPDTRFELTLADSSKIPSGGYWDLQEVGGPTRLTGRVIVVADVTA